jgi:recombinational DNA repair protein RecR
MDANLDLLLTAVYVTADDHLPKGPKNVTRLPGVGNRTAQRLAFHILRASTEDAAALAEAIREMKEKIGLCEVCFNLTDEAPGKARAVRRSVTS